MAKPLTNIAIVPDFAFDHFVVKGESRELLVEGESVKLGTRALDLLFALIERRGRTVSKNELLDVVWPGLVVEENNLQVQVSALRKVLGPQRIATVPGRGYRFTVMPNDGAPPDSLPLLSPASAAAPAAVGNLPPVLPQLFGRGDELQAVVALVRSHRWVTIAGAGGIGKTRLAQEAAQTLRDDWPDGVWMVELAPAANPAQVAAAVAQALRIALPGRAAVQDELVAELRRMTMLLVLDNCEHVLGAAGALAVELMAQAPGVRILTTSQESFHLPDEQLYRLGPLAIPESPDAPQAQESGAIALFLARARAADPRFRPDPQNLTAIIDVCRHLDGLALAIELAAARVPLLGVDGLRARIDDRFRVLTAGARFALRRHQTLRATLDWSHGLLTADEQAVFRRLGVFAGSFGIESAQQVAADGALDEWAVLDHLGALVDKSLVIAEAGDPPRYRLLETGRAFAIEKLSEAGETDATMRRHARAMLALFNVAHEQQWLLTYEARRERYMPDLDNLRAALDWAGGPNGDAEMLIALAGTSPWIWRPAGARLEGMRRCAEALERVDAGTPAALEARLQLSYVLAARPRIEAREIAAIERATVLFREIGDRRSLFRALAVRAYSQAKYDRLEIVEASVGEARALFEPGWPPVSQRELLMAEAILLAKAGRLEEAWSKRETILRLDQAAEDQTLVRNSLINMADLALIRSDTEQAVRIGRDLLARIHAGDFGRSQSGAFAVGNLGAALILRGDLDEARVTLREALDALMRDGEVSYFLDHFALLAYRRARLDDAARALGCVDAWRAKVGHPREPNEARAHAMTLAGLVKALPADRFAQLLQEGAAMSAEVAARLAVAE